jgi:hypothetical protein
MGAGKNDRDHHRFAGSSYKVTTKQKTSLNEATMLRNQPDLSEKTEITLVSQVHSKKLRQNKTIVK